MKDINVNVELLRQREKPARKRLEEAALTISDFEDEIAEESGLPTAVLLSAIKAVAARKRQA